MGGILCLERDIFLGFILQAIESYWISTNLQEFMFLDRFGDNAFNNLCYLYLFNYRLIIQFYLIYSIKFYLKIWKKEFWRKASWPKWWLSCTRIEN